MAGSVLFRKCGRKTIAKRIQQAALQRVRSKTQRLTFVRRRLSASVKLRSASRTHPKRKLMYLDSRRRSHYRRVPGTPLKFYQVEDRPVPPSLCKHSIKGAKHTVLQRASSNVQRAARLRLRKLMYPTGNLMHPERKQPRHCRGVRAKSVRCAQFVNVRVPPQSAACLGTTVPAKRVRFQAVVEVAPACCWESCHVCEALKPREEFLNMFKDTRNKCQSVPKGTFCDEVFRIRRTHDAIFDIDEADVLAEMCRSQEYNVRKLRGSYAKTRDTYKKLGHRMKYADDAEADAFFAPHYQDELSMVLRNLPTE